MQQPPPRQPPQPQYQQQPYQAYRPSWQPMRKDGFLIASAVLGAISLGLFLKIVFLYIINNGNGIQLLAAAESIAQIAIAWVITWFASFICLVVAMIRR